MEEPRLLTVEAAAKRLAVSPLTLYTWAQRGQIPVVRLSRKALRFDPDALDRWISEHSKDAAVGV